MATAWHGFRHMTPANYFSVAAALGVSYVEVPLYHHTLSPWFGPHAPDDIRRLAEECGVEMVAGVSALELAAPFDEIGRPLSDREALATREVALVLIDIARDLGLQVVRITEPSVTFENQHLAEKYVTDYGNALRTIGEYAQQYGIQVTVENYGLSSTQIDLMLRVADHPNVGTLFDPCNYARMGEDPLAALQVMKGRIFYCQLKDTKDDEKRDPDSLFPGSRWRPSVAVGDGDIEWGPLLSELSSTYDGYVSIEYEHEDDVILGTRRSLDFIAAALGSAESSAGSAAADV